MAPNKRYIYIALGIFVLAILLSVFLYKMYGKMRTDTVKEGWKPSINKWKKQATKGIKKGINKAVNLVKSPLRTAIMSVQKTAIRATDSALRAASDVKKLDSKVSSLEKKINQALSVPT
jgi:asparagine synthetase A